MSASNNIEQIKLMAVVLKTDAQLEVKVTLPKICSTILVAKVEVAFAESWFQRSRSMLKS